MSTNQEGEVVITDVKVDNVVDGVVVAVVVESKTGKIKSSG